MSDQRFIKRVGYELVRISTLGGVLEIKPATADGFSVAYQQHADRPQIGHGKDVETACQHLINDLKYKLNAIEEDLKAFLERNR